MARSLYKNLYKVDTTTQFTEGAMFDWSKTIPTVKNNASDSKEYSTPCCHIGSLKRPVISKLQIKYGRRLIKARYDIKVGL